MAQFKFSLHSVLEQRQRDERLAQVDHAQAQLLQRSVEAELATLEHDLRGANEHLRDHHLIGKLDASMISTHRRFLIAMRMAVIAKAQQIAAARLKTEATLRKLASAAKDRKAIELLHDRQSQRWRAQENKKELALADEVAMQMAYHDITVESFAGGAG